MNRDTNQIVDIVSQSSEAHILDEVAVVLAGYFGVECDGIILAEFLSLVAGWLFVPVHLHLTTANLGADLFCANHLLRSTPSAIAFVASTPDLRTLEARGFGGLAVILLRGRNAARLFRDATERMTVALEGLPSIWRITDKASSEIGVGPVLRLMVSKNKKGRTFAGIGNAFIPVPCPVPDALCDLFKRLDSWKTLLDCSFQKEIQAVGAFDDQLVVRRLLMAMAAVRVLWQRTPQDREPITLEDYRRLRSLLVALPVCSADNQLSDAANISAKRIFAEVAQDTYQLTLPDRADDGNKWFTRTDATEWIGMTYNTAKKHLGEMEADGLICSTRDENNRKRGHQIHFRFVDGRTPLSDQANPFADLPEL